MGWHRFSGSLVGASMTLASLACSGDDPSTSSSSALGDAAITVGSFDFAESVVLAEVYSQALEAAGYDVVRAFALGPREFVGPALRNGLIELVPEYAGTAVDFVTLGAAEMSDEAETTHDQLVSALEGAEVRVLDAAPAENTNAFVVTNATSTEHELDELSDLAALAGELTFGGPPECVSRRLCLVGLNDVYDVRFGERLTLDAGGALTRQALRSGHVDVALMFSTDPAIGTDGLVELVDDRGWQPAENVTPLLRTEVVDRWGEEVTDVIDEVSSHLTSEAVRRLSADADGALGGPAVAAAADDWLRSEGLV